MNRFEIEAEWKHRFIHEDGIALFQMLDYGMQLVPALESRQFKMSSIEDWSWLVFEINQLGSFSRSLIIEWIVGYIEGACNEI